MSSKVIRLSRVQEKTREERKVINMPNLFTNLLRAYRQRQDELKQRKVNALYQAAYIYYFDYFQMKEMLRERSEIEIPEFLKTEQIKKAAQERASEEVMKVIKENRINKCFKHLKQYQKEQEKLRAAALENIRG